ncbi:hypothetical protein J3E68DRAFT_227252 [Trichoderma sp. SZMC 28012]
MIRGARASAGLERKRLRVYGLNVHLVDAIHDCLVLVWMTGTACLVSGALTDLEYAPFRLGTRRANDTRHHWRTLV